MVAEYILEHSTDYATRYLEFLLEAWKKTRRKGIVAAILTEVQAWEDASQQVYRECNLDDAVGEQLDRIGRLLQVSRGGYSDAVYRTRLRVEIAILVSNGTPEDLITVVRAAVTPGVEFSFLESYPAGVVVAVLDSVPEFLPAELFAFLNRARALGIRLNLVYSEYPETTFAFSDTSTVTVNPNKGFADGSAPGTGGHLAGVY